ncbi:hypothetical protein ACKKBG_A22680 [Auxenochlorella protothecoides x Auxenochlorella symbiontica]
MQAVGLPCVKLLVEGVLGAQRCPVAGTRGTYRTEWGAPFERVWIQGTVCERTDAGLNLKDSSGAVIAVVVTSRLPGLDLASIVPGDYCLVVGPVAEDPTGPRYVRAHKVINLTAELVDVALRAEQWQAEVKEARALPLGA